MKNTLYFIVSCCMPVAVVLEGCNYPTHTEDHAAMKKIAPLEGQRWVIIHCLCIECTFHLNILELFFPQYCSLFHTRCLL